MSTIEARNDTFPAIVGENVPTAIFRFGEPSANNLCTLSNFLEHLDCHPWEETCETKRLLCGKQDITFTGNLDGLMRLLESDLSADWKDSLDYFKGTPLLFEHLVAWETSCPGLLVVYTRIFAPPEVEFGNLLYGRAIQRVSEDTYWYWDNCCVSDDGENYLTKKALLERWIKRLLFGTLVIMVLCGICFCIKTVREQPQMGASRILRDQE